MTRPGAVPAGMAALVILHFLFLMVFFEPAISTPDANGYMAQARLIAKLGRSDIVTESPAQYVGDHWMRTEVGHYYGQYPPGLPAFLAVFFRLWGPTATLGVIPLLGSLSLVALFLVCREWVGLNWGLLAAVLMALNPVANEHAMAADSHTAVCFFLLCGLFCLIRWDRTGSTWWAAGAGLCVGVIPTIRYAEALFLPAFALFVVLGLRRRPGWWRSLSSGIAAASLPVVALAMRNQEAFGAFWRTGYSISNEQTAFGLGNFARNVIPYLVMILVMGAGPLVLVGVAGVISLWKRGPWRRHALFLTALVVPITLLCMFYYWGADPFSMRFLLPTFFVYAIAGVWFLRFSTEFQPRKAWNWSVILLLVTATWGLPLSILALHRIKRDNSMLATATRAIAEHIDPGSVVIADGGLQQHLDFVGSWRLAPAERAQDRAESFVGEIIAWSGGSRRIFWVGSREKLEAFAGNTGADSAFRTVAEVVLPVTRGGPRGGFGGPPPGGFGGPPPGGLFGPALGIFGFGGPPPGGPPPGGLHPPFPGGPGLFEGPGSADGPRPPRPAHFEPPSDGELLIAEWNVGL